MMAWKTISALQQTGQFAKWCASPSQQAGFKHDFSTQISELTIALPSPCPLS
jgi:hypothetical protein